MFKVKMSLGGGEALLGAAFLFATTNVLVREMAHMWGDYAQIAVRFALVWLLLVAYIRIRGKKVSIPRSKMLMAVMYSLLASIAILFYVLSVQVTTIANTLFTSSATELIAAFLLGTILLNEKVTRQKFLAIGLSLIGLVLYSGALLNGDEGIFFGLLAGVTTAFCNIIAKKLKGVNLTAILRMQFGIGTLLMIVLTLIFSSNDIVRTVSIEGMTTTIIFALILIGATHLVLYGFQHFDVNIASVILSSQLIFGALLGYFLYEEVLSTNEILSGLLIVCAAIVGSVAYRRTPKEIDVHA